MKCNVIRVTEATLTRIPQAPPGYLLYLVAVTATRYNLDIKAQYERLTNKGKSKMSALGAAMRKLVQICFGVLKHQQPYQPQVG
jgi:hypothetical protein